MFGAGRRALSTPGSRHLLAETSSLQAAPTATQSQLPSSRPGPRWLASEQAGLMALHSVRYRSSYTARICGIRPVRAHGLRAQKPRRISLVSGNFTANVNRNGRQRRPEARPSRSARSVFLRTECARRALEQRILGGRTGRVALRAKPTLAADLCKPLVLIGPGPSTSLKGVRHAVPASQLPSDRTTSPAPVAAQEGDQRRIEGLRLLPVSGVSAFAEDRRLRAGNVTGDLQYQRRRGI
jgi:hypothetical protein